MIQINNTLLSKLFIEPNPQPKNEDIISYYKKIYSRMFPYPDDYIEFLKTQSIDKQYECAERIIHRLCYHANFPPSYYALLDVICVENYQKKGVLDTDTYIPQDHFIHSVYLYLLGIYVFFYNSEFYTKIISENRFERNGHFLGNVKIDCIKDFISEWKYFCLYHDIGYSAEILGNTEKFPNRKKAQAELKKGSGIYKASLGKDAILNQHAYFGALEIISKMLFTKFVITNSTEKIQPNHKIYRIYKQKSLTQYSTKTKKTVDISFNEIPDTFLTGMQLDKIYSNHCIKKLLPTINLNDIVIIGLEKDFGNVGFITYIDTDTRIFVYSNEIKSNSEFIHLLEMPNIIMFDDYMPKSFEFIYLLRNLNIEDNISSIVDKDFFDSTYNQIERLFDSDFKGIADETQFLNFPYIIYQWLFSKIKKRLDNTKLEECLESQNFSYSAKSQEEITNDLLKRGRLIYQSILESLEEYHPLLMKKCNELLQKKMKEITVKSKDITSPNVMLSKFVEKYFQILSSMTEDQHAKQIFLNELMADILLQIEEDIDLLQLFSQIFVQLKCTLNKSDSIFEFDYITGETKVPCFFEESIEKKVQEKMSMNNIETVCSEYIFQYGNTVDHGILSAEYAAGVFSCYRNALLESKNQQEQLLLSILLDIPNGIEESRVRYIDNYNHVFTNVLFAIFVHNLYPSSFDINSKGKEYKTKMSDPFTYLSLLCDSLQKWNRPRSLHPTLFENHPLNGVSEKYNIEIEDNIIFLSDIDIENDQWLDDNIAMLDTYLANIKAFVKHKR